MKWERGVQHPSDYFSLLSQYSHSYNINSCGLRCAVRSVMWLCFVMEEIFRALWGTVLIIILAKQLLVIPNNDGYVEIQQVKRIPIPSYQILGPSLSKASLISFQVLPSRLFKFLTLSTSYFKKIHQLFLGLPLLLCPWGLQSIICSTMTRNLASVRDKFSSVSAVSFSLPLVSFVHSSTILMRDCIMPKDLKNYPKARVCKC